LAEELCYGQESRGFSSRYGHWIFQFTILSDCPGVDLATNINEFLESSWGINCGWPLRLTTSPLRVSRVFSRGGISESQRPISLCGLLQGQLYLYSLYLLSIVFLTTPRIDHIETECCGMELSGSEWRVMFRSSIESCEFHKCLCVSLYQEGLSFVEEVSYYFSVTTTTTTTKKENYPSNRPWRPIGLSDVKDPTLSRQSAQMVVRLSALSTRRTLLHRNIIIFMFHVLISVRG
jgi:hypothetical protein